MTTPSESAEQLDPAHAALQRYIELLREGDVLGFADGLTSEAYVDFLHMVPLMAEWKEESVITIVPQDLSGDEHVFALHLQAEENHSLDVTMKMRLLNDSWQVTHINIPGVRERA